VIGPILIGIPQTTASCLVRIVTLALFAALSGCGTVKSGLPEAPAVPEDVAEPMNLPPYKIQVGDVLGIKLLQANELSEDVTVRPDGHISTSVVEDQQASGVDAGQRQATLFARTLALCAQELGIDQNQRLISRLAHIQDDDPTVHIHLCCGEADAVRGVHGF